MLMQIYVADCCNYRVQVLNSRTGDWKRNIGDGNLSEPFDVEILGNNNNSEIYVLDYGNHRVCVLNKNDGRLIRYLGDGFGTGDKNLDYPRVFRMHQNQLYISDYSNHKIKVYE